MSKLVRQTSQLGDAERLVNECLSQLLERSREGARSIAEALDDPTSGASTFVESAAREVIGCLKARSAIEEALRGLDSTTKADNVINRLCGSSLFLRDVHKELVGDPEGRERLLPITGPYTTDGIGVLSRVEEVALERQSRSYVAANREDCHRKQVELAAKHGHEVLAVFHSHMSEGAESTRQSATDIAAQRRMESIGSHSISGIFSVDGFLRLFTLSVPFEFSAYGSDISIIEDTPHEKLLKLEAV